MALEKTVSLDEISKMHDALDNLFTLKLFAQCNWAYSKRSKVTLKGYLNTIALITEAGYNNTNETNVIICKEFLKKN